MSRWVPELLLFGGRDEILIREVGLRRNDDSDTSSFGFNYCAEALGARVFTQPGSKADSNSGTHLRPLLGVKQT